MSHTRLESTLSLLQTLVEFDTRSARSNLELITFVREYLAGFGVEASLNYNETGDKANLYATIGPRDRAGLCLSGHTDVVPADGQPWTVPPFALTRESGRVLGRGTADMKGFLACVLASVPYFVEHCRTLPIHLAFSYDEEVGCRGVRGLLDELARAPFKPLACIIGEPTSMQVAIAHKGKRAYRCCFKGLAGHSALTHLGVNAVDFAAEFAVHLRRASRALRESGQHDARFEPPYTTVHTGKLNGGIALNVIPDHAELEFEVRNLPGDSIDTIVQAARRFAEDELEGEMRATHADTGIEWQELVDYPALSADPDANWLRDMACELTGDETLRTLSFGTEGGLFQGIGIPTVVCGPGSIEQGHKADEYVEIAQLERCLGFLDKLAVNLPASVPGYANA
ncbi:Acetylornithine deacetylase [Paraburkholderia tropica]|uniref:acetylornithine deacetylase n=1 Tax=Paraburkholderia tropica TaxID=92647 RepID=UPI001CAED330|nr:acetylornithine deacetylase [Paraburkholderia tropica]CAG9221521.1 Acetylornithine deacetylase [Paraburkholderia tropica]